MISDSEIAEKRKLLYRHWHELPFRKLVTTASYLRLEQSDVKSFIVKYIRDGVEDEFGKANGLLRRHAFTVKELKEAFQLQSSIQKYSISNFHFHINNLVEEGYIQEITKILDGRHYVGYYGRTARTFTPSIDEVMNSLMDKNIFDPLKSMMRELNPEISTDEIAAIINEHKFLLTEFYSGLGDWMKDMYPHIYNSKLDMKDFEHYAAHFSLLNEAFSKSLRSIARLTNLDKYVKLKNKIKEITKQSGELQNKE